jgi:hypothetical protein
VVASRGWIIAALGVVVIASAGAGSVLLSRKAPNSTITAAPHWGLYTPTSWNRVATKFEQRGFSRASIHVVTGTKPAGTGQSFAILGARSGSGRTCFAVARGTALGTTICTVSKPLVIFAAPDLCAQCAPGGTPVKTLTILSLVRRDVTSVTMIDQGRESGVVITPAGGGTYAFNSETALTHMALRARGKGASILAQVPVHLP